MFVLVLGDRLILGLQGGGTIYLFDANVNVHSFVLVLYWDAYWHTYTLLFLFYLFTATRNFALRERGL